MAQRLKKTDDRFQKLIEQTPDAMLIDVGGRIVYVNKATLRLLGAVSPAKILGRPRLDFIHPDFHPVVKERIKKLIQDGDPVAALDEKWLRVDGGVVDVEVLASPIDWGGEAGIHVTVRDITMRKETETQLIGLIDATQDAVISIDRQAHIVMFNPSAERIFGYTKAEVQGRKINMLMAEPYGSEHDTYIKRYEKTGEKRSIGQIRTVAGRRKNGETFPIELSVAQVAWGKDVNYAAFIRDISEKIKRDHDLIENSRLVTIGTTVSRLVHEIGNPLNGMYLTAQVLERRLNSPGSLPDPHVSGTFNKLVGEIKRLNSMVTEFRASSRAPRYEFTATPLEPVVQDVLSLERPRYINQGISISNYVPADLPAVLADAEKLKQVIFNLCKNAADAMPKGGTLTLRASNNDRQALLEISDTGWGIPEGIDIWAPFVTTKKDGTGLGLMIIREIVTAHRGTIDYMSTVGKGTTFRLTLPLSRRI
jgi:two-component system sensor kinase FixL